MIKSSKFAKAVNSYFPSFAESLEHFKWPYLPSNAANETQVIIDSFSGHSSIIKIKQKFRINKKFSFKCISGATFRKVKNFPSNKVIEKFLFFKTYKMY